MQRNQISQKCSLTKTDYKYKKNYTYKVVITAALVKTIIYMLKMQFITIIVNFK